MWILPKLQRYLTFFFFFFDTYYLRTQVFLQWKRGSTRAWRWISCSQGHREHCHGMWPSLQHAHHHPPEGSTSQHHNSPSIRPDIRLRWQRNRRVLRPATEYDWSDTEEGHSCVQGDWNAKVGMDACGNWQGVCGPFCNDDANERRLRLLEFATLNDLVLASTFDHRKAPREMDMT